MKSLLFMLIAVITTIGASAQQVKTVPTFESISIYWSPNGGGPDKEVEVRFRATGTTEWKQGLNMKFNPQNPSFDMGDYRGSIVYLNPDTEYEIELTLEGTTTKAICRETTWSEQFPEAEVIAPGNLDHQLTITQSGSKDGYIVYDGQGDTIDVNNEDDACIHVKASYIIIRNYVLTGGKKFGIFLKDDIHDVVIEDCDISNWGRIMADGWGTQEGAIQSTEYNTYDCGDFTTDITRIVVQRNKIHNPRSDANSWAEGRGNPLNYHPIGPQAIMFLNSTGNHVIRYNQIWSDADHYYNDIIGYGCNQDWTGFPGPDSDIYGNYLANCWDEPIEVEGGGRNIRVWNNYMEDCFGFIAAAGTRIGPIYVWNNVSGKSYSPPGSEYGEYGIYFKQEYDEDGYKYLFNNTILQPNGEGAGGIQSTYNDNERLMNMITRNNVLNVHSTTAQSIGMGGGSVNNDFDYDLCNKAHPAEPNGLDGVPDYIDGAGFDIQTMTGNYTLKPSSKGYDAGTVIPNFRENYNGAAPDMGASEAGDDPYEYGTEAYKCDETFGLIVTTDGHGSVTPLQGNYCKGATVQLRATSDLGWALDKWFGNLTGTENPAFITMDGNKTVFAFFKAVPVYSLSVTSENGEVTYFPEGDKFNAGTEITITATPAYGYEFDKWSGDFSSNDNPATFTMDGDKNITAVFKKLPEFNLNINKTGKGDVILSPDGGSYAQGTKVTMTAQPEPGYVFTRWEGDATGSENPIEIVMDDNKTVTAVFTKHSNLLAYWQMNESEGITLKDAGGYEQDVTLNNSDDNTFVAGKVSGGVYFDGNRDGKIADASFFQVESLTIAAYVKVDASHYDWAWVAGHGDNYGLYVTGDGTAELYFYNGSDWLDVAGSINIRDNNWHHIAGTFDKSTERISIYVDGVLDKENVVGNSIHYAIGTDFHVGTMEGQRQFKGVIDELRVYDKALTQSEVAALVVSGTQYTLETNAPNGAVSITPFRETYNENSVVSMAAIPDENYEFKNWDGDATGTDNPLNMVMDGNKSVTAVFIKSSFVEEMGDGKKDLIVYPNPFSNGTTVTYKVPKKTKVQLIVYNINGNPVKVLVDQTRQAGTYQVKRIMQGCLQGFISVLSCMTTKQNIPGW